MTMITCDLLKQTQKKIVFSLPSVDTSDENKTSYTAVRTFIHTSNDIDSML